MKYHAVMFSLFLTLSLFVLMPSAVAEEQATQQIATQSQSQEDTKDQANPDIAPAATSSTPAKNKFVNSLSHDLNKKAELTGSSHDVTNSLLQVTLGLFVVLVVIAGAAWFARRFGHFNMAAKGNLRIVGGLHLGSRERVVLMQVGEQQLLVGVAPGRIQTLHVLETPIDFEDNSHPDKPLPGGVFGALLKKVQQS